MKTCPTCGRTYEDTLFFCLADGAALPSTYDPNATLQLPETRKTEPPVTEVLPGPGTNPVIAVPTKQEVKPPQLISNVKEESKPGKIIGRILVTLIIVALLALLAISVSWGVYNSVQLSGERSARAKAEQEATTSKTALATAEKRAKDAEDIVAAHEDIRLGKEVWRVVKVENRTQGEMPYQLSVSGESYNFTVAPGKSNLHFYSGDITIIYDHQYTSGYQEKRYYLTPKYVTGHKPTDAETQLAKPHYFTPGKSDDIEFYYDK